MGLVKTFVNVFHVPFPNNDLNAYQYQIPSTRWRSDLSWCRRSWFVPRRRLLVSKITEMARNILIASEAFQYGTRDTCFRLASEYSTVQPPLPVHFPDSLLSQLNSWMEHKGWNPGPGFL